jgi:hypothetical protein
MKFSVVTTDARYAVSWMSHHDTTLKTEEIRISETLTVQPKPQNMINMRYDFRKIYEIYR